MTTTDARTHAPQLYTLCGMLALGALGCSNQRTHEVSRNVARADGGSEPDEARDASAEENDAEPAPTPPDAAEPARDAALPDAASTETDAGGAHPAPLPDAGSAGLDDASSETGGEGPAEDAALSTCPTYPEIPAGYFDVASRPGGGWVASGSDAELRMRLKVFDGSAWGDEQLVGVQGSYPGSGLFMGVAVDGLGATYAAQLEAPTTTERPSLLRRVMPAQSNVFGPSEPAVAQVESAALVAFSKGGAAVAFVRQIFDSTGRLTARQLETSFYTAGSASWSTPQAVAGALDLGMAPAPVLATNVAGQAAVHYYRGSDHWIASYDGAAWSAPVLHPAASRMSSSDSIALFSNGDVLVGFIANDGRAQVQRYRVATQTWNDAEPLDVIPASVGGPFNQGSFSSALLIDPQDGATFLAMSRPGLTCYGGQTWAYRNLGAGWSTPTVLGHDANTNLVANARGDVLVLNGSTLSSPWAHHATPASTEWSSQQLRLPDTGGYGCSRIVSPTVDLARQSFVGLFTDTAHGTLLCL